MLLENLVVLLTTRIWRFGKKNKKESKLNWKRGFLPMFLVCVCVVQR